MNVEWLLLATCASKAHADAWKIPSSYVFLLTCLIILASVAYVSYHILEYIMAKGHKFTAELAEVESLDLAFVIRNVRIYYRRSWFNTGE